MKLSAFDLNHARALHYLLEEAHVGRAASHLGITPAAASNALRRLRDELGDPLLVKRGRGLVRTRRGEELRFAASEVIASAERLLNACSPFDPATFRGPLSVAMAEHVAEMLLPEVDRLVRMRAPRATLALASIPVAAVEWLEQTGGIIVGPTGRFAAASTDEKLAIEDFYVDRYTCVMRRGHPVGRRRWDAATYAAQAHIVVTPRGRSDRSDVDEQLEARGLSRRIERYVPSFTLALGLVAHSDLITTIPERCAREMRLGELVLREVPLALNTLAMKLIVHPAHAHDDRVAFTKQLLKDASANVELRRASYEVARRDA